MPAMETMESVLGALWRASWQASWLILLVLLAQVTLRRWLSPAWRSALWLLVVARLLLPFTPPSAWSLFNLTSHFDALRAMALHPPAAVEANAHRSAGLRHGDVEPSYPLQHADSREAGTPATIPPGAPFQTAFNDPALGEASRPPVPAATIQASRGSWLPMLFWIWLTGVLVLGARIVCGACSLSRRVRRNAVVADRQTIELLEESCRVIGTRHTPVLMETDAVDSPALFGLLRPKLLLPTGLIRRLDEFELRHVFLHELAHLRRHDVLLNWLAALLQILHWFNPMIWFGFARMRADRELACDALALSRSAGIDRAAYGTTILKLVSDLTPARPVAGLVGISEDRSQLKRRIRWIASYRRPTYWSTAMGTVILPLLAAVSLTDARAHRDAEEQDDAPMDAVRQQVDASRPGGTAVGAEPEQAPASQLQKGAAGGETTSAGAIDPVPLASPLASTNLTYIGPGRQGIQSKFQHIILKEFQSDGLTLPVILGYLGDVVHALDPDLEGINFIIDPNPIISTDAPRVDPTTGQVIPPQPAEPRDMMSVMVRVVPAIRSVRLGDVLDAIIRGADAPLRYLIEEHGVVFTPKPPGDSLQIETRIFKVNAEKLLAEIRSTGLAVTDGSGANPQGLVRSLLMAAGVDIRPPNQIYFNDRKGVLMVDATQQELEIVQRVMDMFQASPVRTESELPEDGMGSEPSPTKPPQVELSPSPQSPPVPPLRIDVDTNGTPQQMVISLSDTNLRAAVYEALGSLDIPSSVRISRGLANDDEAAVRNLIDTLLSLERAGFRGTEPGPNPYE